jgi:hypothetical protein
VFVHGLNGLIGLRALEKTVIKMVFHSAHVHLSKQVRFAMVNSSKLKLVSLSVNVFLANGVSGQHVLKIVELVLEAEHERSLEEKMIAIFLNLSNMMIAILNLA